MDHVGRQQQVPGRSLPENQLTVKKIKHVERTIVAADSISAHKQINIMPSFIEFNL